MVAAGLSKDAAVDALAQRPAASLSLGTALGLICLPSLAFALGQLWLLAGGHIARGSAIVILTASACVSLLLARRVAGTWVASLAVATIVLLATLLSGLAIDTSYDGQRYHFDAITALAQGWNPYRTPTPTPDIVKLVGPRIGSAARARVRA